MRGVRVGICVDMIIIHCVHISIKCSKINLFLYKRLPTLAWLGELS